jgi:vancomycin resistance protein YoaR
MARPSFTTADALALHVRSELGAAAAKVGRGMVPMIRMATGQLNGTVVLPGADFSYRGSVGPASVGTAASPLGNATQGAASRAHMVITQRPGGLAFQRDLRFRNTSVFPVYVRAFSDPLRHGGAVVTVQIWGTRAAG